MLKVALFGDSIKSFGKLGAITAEHLFQLRGRPCEELALDAFAVGVSRAVKAAAGRLHFAQ